MNGVELIRDFLIECRVDRIFGVPGYANYPLFVGTTTTDELDVVLTKHEAAAAWMAYGYALSTGKFGVCTGTSGAGTTNLVPGVVSAYYNSMPLLVLTGQVETTKFGKGAFQELTGTGTRSVSAVDLYRPLTKLSLAVHDVDELPAALEKAYEALTSGRLGPVHLSLPVDVQKAELKRPVKLALRSAPPPRGTSADVARRVRGILDGAEAPLVLLGRGCRRHASAARRFVQDLDLPFCTSMQAKGLLATGHGLDLGMVGIAGTPRANHYLTDVADVLLVVGSSLNEFTTGGFSPDFVGTKTLIHVDLDERELGKNYAAEIAIHDDAEHFFAQVLAVAPAGKTREVSAAARAAAEKPLKQPVVRDKDDPARIAPMDLMRLLEEKCPDDTVFVADSGNNAVWAVHYLTTRSGQDFQIDINTGCMASGVISAVGSQLARPDRPVVCICGDGGFMMSGFEATTAADYGIPVLWVVMNDHKLGMVKQGASEKYGTSIGDEFKHCDVAATARTLGVDGCVASTPAEVEAALADYFHDRRPYVLDVRFNDAYLPQVYARVRKTREDEAFKVK